MKKSSLFILVVFIVLTCSCGGEGEDDIIYIFDGDECTHSGPSNIDPGLQPIVQKNLTDIDVQLWVERLHTEKGKTAEEYREYWEAIEDWHYAIPPPYVSSLHPKSLISTDGNDEVDEVWEWDLKPGQVYVTGFYAHTEHRGHFVCPPLETKEGVTE